MYWENRKLTDGFFGRSGGNGNVGNQESKIHA